MGFNPEKFDELRIKVEEHLDLRGPELDSLLKGHLLIEDILFKILVATTGKEKLIRMADLSFYKAAILVQALHEDKFDSWLWEAVISLNTIRNKIAHHLDFPGLNKLIEEFVELVTSNTTLSSVLDNLHDHSVLASKIYSVCICLTYVLDEIET